MIPYIGLLVFFALAYLREAKHDALISSFPQDIDDNIAWHKYDWQYLALIGVGVSLFGSGFYPGIAGKDLIFAFIHAFCIGVSIASLKVLVFNIRINFIFDNAWNYVSSKGLESKFKGKENIYYALALILFLASSGLIILAYANIFK